MSFDPDRLYNLLPAIHRMRDAEQGEPLRALLALIAEQTGILEEDLEQLYDDQFIETCAPWVLPYIGDLIGYRSLHPIGPDQLTPRAEVANTIGYRRRKGTASMLEQLARDVTGWNARAVEFFQLLGWTQFMNHIRLTNYYAPDLREWEPLERLGTAFDTSAHTDRRAPRRAGEGKYNIPNIGIFLWRLNAYRLRSSPAVRVDDRAVSLQSVGANTAALHPAADREIDHASGRADQCSGADQPARARAELATLLRRGTEHVDRRRRRLTTSASAISPMPMRRATWAHTPPNAPVAIDPVLGRISFRDAQTRAAAGACFTTDSAPTMGGGEYERTPTFDAALGAGRDGGVAGSDSTGARRTRERRRGGIERQRTL